MYKAKWYSIVIVLAIMLGKWLVYALVGGCVMLPFGFAYSSMGAYFAVFALYPLLEVLPDAWLNGFSCALAISNLQTVKGVRAMWTVLYLCVHIPLSCVILAVLDHLFSSVQISPLAVLIYGAVTSLPTLRRNFRRDLEV